MSVLFRSTRNVDRAFWHPSHAGKCSSLDTPTFQTDRTDRAEAVAGSYQGAFPCVHSSGVTEIWGGTRVTAECCFVPRALYGAAVKGVL